ncbi:MAG: hypothetical protein AAGA75_14085 [Cyanobacteria bacterium P01_E01_bin.6]
MRLQDAPFATLTALPKDGKPVTTWGNDDTAFLDIAKGIRRAVRDLQQQPEFLQDICPYQGLEAFTPASAQFFLVARARWIYCSKN